jgi:uncharacterized protein (TIGR00369 family)
MTGLELLRHGADDNRPSLRRLIGMRFDELEFGRVVMSVETTADFANPIGTVHGGIAATLLDSVMSGAVHTTLPAGVSYTTLGITIHYTRAAQIDGQRLVGTGAIVHAGRRTATAEGRVIDENGKLIAHGTTTCLILGG